mmetsp:Transcript_25759/g.61352  ORF Transcript_25759/g.61352 Transcript_25759/m.61352 type:complete len:272 (+) Transcript_25759:305-1120(+)
MGSPFRDTALRASCARMPPRTADTAGIGGADADWRKERRSSSESLPTASLPASSATARSRAASSSPGTGGRPCLLSNSAEAEREKNILWQRRRRPPHPAERARPRPQNWSSALSAPAAASPPPLLAEKECACRLQKRKPPGPREEPTKNGTSSSVVQASHRSWISSEGAKRMTTSKPPICSLFATSSGWPSIASTVTRGFMSRSVSELACAILLPFGASAITKKLHVCTSPTGVLSRSVKWPTPASTRFFAVSAAKPVIPAINALQLFILF